MNLSPYRNDPERIFFDEPPDWEAKYRDMKAERDLWQQRAGHAEHLLDRLETECGIHADSDRCVIPNCKSKSQRGASFFLCPDHMRAVAVSQEVIWSQQSRKEMAPEDREYLDSRKRHWVVYYLAMGSNRVKIGRTVDLRKRMRTFSAHPDQLLAVEPGTVLDGVDRETQRHREFAEWRVGLTELFEMSPELDAHIKQVRDTFGDPQQLLA